MSLKGIMYYFLSKLILLPLVLLLVFLFSFLKSGVKAGAKHGLKAGAKSGVSASARAGVKASGRSGKGVIRDKAHNFSDVSRGAVQQAMPRSIQSNIQDDDSSD